MNNNPLKHLEGRVLSAEEWPYETPWWGGSTGVNLKHASLFRKILWKIFGIYPY